MVVLAVALGFAAIRLRERLLPDWDGAPARLAEVVLGLALLTFLLQLLGTLSLLCYWPMLIGAVAIAAAVHAAVRRWPAGGHKTAVPERRGAPRIPTWMTLGSIAIAVLLAAHWATGVQASWAGGLSGFDTMWYHAPFAARFAETGSTNALHFTDPEYLHWFYPQDSELLHAGGIVLFDSDLLSPLVNLGWLALALLAAWCIGRPYGAAPLSMLAVAAVLDTNTMVPREAGTAANDIATVALLLAAAAVLLNSQRWREWGVTGALIVAGLAAGMSIGTKLTTAAAVAALTVGVIVLARGFRARTALIWLASVAATGGFWFARNMFHAGGNPFPWLANNFSFLPGPERGLEGRDPFSVSHYLLPPDGGVVGTYFLPELDGVFGPLWPLLLALAAGGMVAALLRGRTPTVRMFGAVAIAAAVGYLFTPLTASGPDGAPQGFAINLRYLAPALALGMALLPLDRFFEDRRAQIGGFALLALLTASIALFSDAKTAWQDDHASAQTALAIALALVAVPLGLALLGRERPRLVAGIGAGFAALVLTVGWFVQDDYLRNRYTEASRFHLETAFRWANDVSESRIAVGGTTGAFFQYGLYGRDASNYVQYVGRPGDDGDFSEIRDCPGWLAALNDGDYQYLVTTPRLDLNNAGKATPSPEGKWVRGDPAATRIAHDGRIEVFRLRGDLDPTRCK